MKRLPESVIRKLTFEDTEQISAFEYFGMKALQDGRYRRIWHPQNEGKCSKLAGYIGQLKGKRAGVSDIVISHPVDPFHGAFIELKVRTNEPTEEQLTWLADMQEAGYFCAVVWGADQLISVVDGYFAMEKKKCPTK